MKATIVQNPMVSNNGESLHKEWRGSRCCGSQMGPPLTFLLSSCLLMEPPLANTEQKPEGKEPSCVVHRGQLCKAQNRKEGGGLFRRANVKYQTQKVPSQK